MINRIKLKFVRDTLALKKKIFQIKMGLTGNTRPHSYPYISSDSFRFMADHVFDEISEDTKVLDVKTGDIVFLNNSSVEPFFKLIHIKIKKPYVLIMHGGTKPIDNNRLKYLDNKIIHWFSKNVLTKDEKVTPLPIGLENLYEYGTGITSLYDKFKKKKQIYKKNKILYHFKIATNPTERQKAWNYISKHPLAETFPTKLPPPLYLKKLGKYKFVLSPPGAGEECHRTWEALYLGVIPIVKKCVATEYFAKIGVPMWVVNDWNELDNIDEQFLNQKYSEIMNNKNDDTLYMNYWIQKISEKSNKSFTELKKKYD